MRAEGAEWGEGNGGMFTSVLLGRCYRVGGGASLRKEEWFLSFEGSGSPREFLRRGEEGAKLDIWGKLKLSSIHLFSQHFF